MSVERRTFDRDLQKVIATLKRELRPLYPAAQIEGYRHYPEAIWIRIVDSGFASMPITQRDAAIWHVLDTHLPEALVDQIGLLLLLAPDELLTSAMNQRFGKLQGIAT